jgi:hypothetical protein
MLHELPQGQNGHHHVSKGEIHLSNPLAVLGFFDSKVTPSLDEVN